MNWGWLCDRGRFNFEAVGSEQRLGAPLVRGEGGLAETTWNAALDVAAQLISDTVKSSGPGGIALLGGARGTNEDAFAWARLADAIGIDHRDAQVGDGLPAELLDLPRATIDEAAAAKTIVLLGPDLKEELPVLYLRLRHAAEQRRSRILELGPIETGLTRYAWRSVRVETGSRARLGAALADAAVKEQLGSGPVVVVAGRANLAESAGSAMSALRTVLEACPDAKVLPALRRGNVVGALQLGLTARGAGSDGLGILEAAADGRTDLLVLLGVDPIADCPDADLARRALAGARRVIAVDTFLTESSRRADVVLAAAAFGEKSGTTTNLEGRVTAVAQKVTVTGTSRPDWMIAAQLAERLGHDDVADELASLDAITDAIAARVPAYAGATRQALDEEPDGVLALPPTDGPVEWPEAASAGALDRNSYDYRLVVSRKLYDRAVGTAMSPSLAGLAPPSAAHVNPFDLAGLGVADGTEVQVIGARGSVVLPLAADLACPAARCWCRSTCRERRSPTSSTPARRPTTSEWSGCDRGARPRSAADRRPLVDAADHRPAQGGRDLRRRPGRARCSWCGSSARSSPACRTGSGRTRPARSAPCRPSPTGSSCSSRRTCSRTRPTGSCSSSPRTSPSSPPSSSGR